MTLKGMLVSTIVSALALATVAAMQYPTSGQQSPSIPPPTVYQDAGWGQHGQPRTDAYGFAQKYVKSEKEDERRELRRQMEDALAKEFDQQAERQKKEIDDLEAQIRKLRELMDKRRTHRSDIINRRMEQLVNDASGLGWNTPGGSRGTTVMGGFYAPPATIPAVPSGFGTPVPARSNETPRGVNTPRP